MKTLYILRHGEKDLSNPNTDDYDIKLTQKGLNDIKILAQKLKQNNIKPDLIVSSPAVRTQQTADIIAQELNYKKSIMYNEVLYQAFVNELIESITYTFDDVQSLMIIGHNPSLTALGITLAGLKDKIEMSELIKIEFDCNSWTSIDISNARLAYHLKPD